MTVNPAFAPMLDAFVSGFNNLHGSFAGEVNAQVAAHNAAKGEKVSPRKYYADTDNEEVRALLEKWSKLLEAIASIESTLTARMEEDIANSSGDAATAKQWLDENQKSIREFNSARRGIIKSVLTLGMGKEEQEHLENELVSVARPKGSAGNSGVKRPRFESITVNGDSLDKPTLTMLAHTTKVSKEDIDKALYAAAGVDDVANFEGDAITFNLTDTNGETFAVVAEPKKSAAAAAADNSAAAADDDEPSADDLEEIDAEFDGDDD